MDFLEAKKDLIENYIKIGFKKIEEHENQVYFERNERSFRNESILHQYILEKKDIEQYLEWKNANQINEGPLNCSIIGKKYLEVAINITKSVAIDFPMVFGDPSNIEIEIGYASWDFVQFFQFNIDFRIFIEMAMSSRRFEDIDRKNINYTLKRPYTLQIKTERIKDIISNNDYLKEFLRSLRFEIAYDNEIVVTRRETWKRFEVKKYREFNPFDKEKIYKIPKSKYSKELVGYYLRSLLSTDQEYQFLSYYHILEYYFLQVTDRELYKKLSILINDPTFNCSHNHLDSLRNVFESYKINKNETDMLKNVLVEYIDEEKIIDFISKYERFFEDKFYTSKKEILGENIQIVLQKGHALPNLAKRIKIIRNYLVHSIDFHEFKPRNSQNNFLLDDIYKEIPLMKFLAEQVIIANVTPLV